MCVCVGEVRGVCVCITCSYIVKKNKTQLIYEDGYI